ncbi:uncharacterized protein E0L32_010416 [Thyridium curvatum]|uniref:Reverse transcriptase domain-containing protein n=1 Tax=Thyridium curvatum TaxID=1093900 RepID=A0A507ASS2_9PEZI|nr:uncharacterized protein E0L32_010416 [Thyridium curvatum]TPX07961.1 hypothetical protein E0L32_010416 [Thyridium curvatum]
MPRKQCLQQCPHGTDKPNCSTSRLERRHQVCLRQSPACTSHRRAERDVVPFPEWIIHFIWQFLQDRRILFEINGEKSKVFHVNVGIPQGSPLSPILFLLFSSDILQGLKDRNAFRLNAEAFSFGYVDDHYLVVSSPSYQRNCDALEIMHKALMGWAKKTDTLFSPAKYAVMHFRGPDAEDEVCQLVPKIEGLPSDVRTVLKTELKILGVTVDHKLSWKNHIGEIDSKVARSLAYYRRIAGPSWGASLDNMRRIYLSNIRPIISYACGAWFIRGTGLRHQLTKADQRKLESIQSGCLAQMSGALRTTSSDVVRKELNIEPICAFLERMALAHRARSAETPFYQKLRDTMRTPIPGIPFRQVGDSYIDRNPYAILFDKAERLSREARDQGTAHLEGEDDQSWTPRQRHRLIGRLAEKMSQGAASDGWDEYRDGWKPHHQRDKRSQPVPRERPLVLEEKWGPQSYKLYKGLSRAQSTMLLQCRTGCIGLAAYLFSIKADPDNVCPWTTLPLACVCLSQANSCNAFQITSPSCPCGKGLQTVTHMFLYCPRLENARAQLIRETMNSNLKAWLTRDAALATDWAIRHFGIPSFEWARSKIMQLSAYGTAPVLFLLPSLKTLDRLPQVFQPRLAFLDAEEVVEVWVVGLHLFKDNQALKRLCNVDSLQ